MFFGDGFPFGGGRHGHGHGGHEAGRKRKEANTTEYYDLLGVAKDASQDDIRKAYKKLAVKHHPDKGGDEAKFKEIQEAANVLMDEDKRKVYDEHGKEGLDAGLGEGGDPGDIFSALFGGGRGGGGRRQQQQIAPIVRKVELTLEDFYCGKTFEIPIERKRPCTACNGSGASKPGISAKCDDCNGQGIQLVRRQLAPGFVQQMQVQCEKCEGTGSYIPKKFQCQECKGEKLKTDQKVFTVEVHKGMSHGEKITFRDEGHKVPELQAGDVVVVLLMAQHNTFARKGNDLLHEKKISLAEALDCNHKLSLTHLDKRHLVIARPAGGLITPGQVMKVSNEGMPKPENPNYKGDLFIRFEIVFPASLSPEAAATILASLAPHNPNLASHTGELHDDHDWECHMEPVDLAQFGKKSRKTREAYDEEGEGEDDDERQGGVQCQQM